ncbi:rhodanese-like domain-containing protein [Ulvibacter antarcticus]|uniref:Rhodanese-related sulfurtransferase n=1 Tax=Ulvibacter antarcticus TaxID=442714 RepID=A0A3L9YFS4_9FLAO|nr:rhodanese-like domain-containing protein [Ulvibacter antarcticus]RMA56788.1 rhodanese-related sulfurtransferase [Ulvibacter antarcticus]
MKKLLLIAIFSCAIALQSCAQKEAAAIKVISPQEVYDAIYSPSSDAQLLDVRTDQEYGVSHLKNAQNICVTTSDFQEKVKTLDKNKPVYVYCKKGGRSAKAAKILADLGFKEIYDMQGGLTNWEDNELEVEN